jgi:hypothetical protein
MSFRNLAIAAIAIASLSACSGNNDKQTFAPSAQEEGSSGNAGAYQAGTPLYTFSVEEGSIMIDNSHVDSIDDAALEGYPTLASHTKAIGSVTKAVETNGNALELYAGDEMLMAFDTRGDSEALLWSRDGFNAQNVVYSRSEASEQDQTPASGEVTFTLNECKVAEEKVEEKQQEQEQGKVEEKQQEQGKVEEKQQEQGKVEEKQAQEQAKLAGFVGSEEQGQEKGQEQEQGKVEEKGAPAPECKTVVIKLNLRQIVEEKKQEQGKVEEKQQEQGKVEEKQQEQGKVEEKQQEQGKVEEKQQDQGKVEEKQQEQGKQEQAQGQEKR